MGRSFRRALASIGACLCPLQVKRVKAGNPLEAVSLGAKEAAELTGGVLKGEPSIA